MPFLKRLVVTNLRNIITTNIHLSPEINIFYGDNGSGKTSLLEAISLLGLGRSFRSHKTRSLINHKEDELTVFADYLMDANEAAIPIGIEKLRNGSGNIRVQGETIRSASVLAKQLPLLLINANSFQLIEGSPNQRRQFLDWMVFHVKPEFAVLWKTLEKTLKQRNSLLRRDKISYSDIKVWDIEYCRIALEIDTARQSVFDEYCRCFNGLETDFSVKGLSVEMEYIRGWDKSQSLSDVLQSSFERDARDGYTHYGPQRADIKIRVEKKPAADVLSRGQEKALICAMTVAQAFFFKEKSKKNCVFLVDDLLAEMDMANSEKLANWLSVLNAQVFVTGVVKDQLINVWNKSLDVNVFHVKHGTVNKMGLSSE